MSLKNQVPNVYGVGLRSVGAYQVSGRPWVTGSANFSHTGDFGIHDGTTTASGVMKLSFPYVTKTIYIQSNSSSDRILVYFNHPTSSGGVTGSAERHFITVFAGQNFTFDAKCKELYLQAVGSTQQFELIADLTNIPTSSMYELTGSGLTG